ncbi:MAG TPA: hypothetical protein VHF69_14125 [Candidatus Synoicihabitans sp.]|nr:hypothetical protein [Candidatus Synoicihabitans sp.]
MKIKFLRGGAWAATSILLPVVLFASAASPAVEAEASEIEVREKFDTNGDGTLDAAERDAARATLKERAHERRAAKQEKFDRDDDGRLDRRERRALSAANREAMEQRPQVMARFDTNKDGKLSRSEWRTARREIRRDLQEKRDGAQE